MADLYGLLVVDKPLGCSSMDVVRRVRRAGGGVKTGHAGTLDPLATGVLICCLGRATRAVQGLMDLTKVYLAQVDLSAFTATDDREGDREQVAVNRPPDRSVVSGVLGAFEGFIQQKPPAYSAVHVQGQRAYRLARRGQAVSIPSRTVRIDGIDLLHYEWPLVTLRVTCGKGTYIRSLARDLGSALGTGGHLASLQRCSIGPYDLTAAVTMDHLDQHPLRQADLLSPPPPLKANQQHCPSSQQA